MNPLLSAALLFGLFGSAPDPGCVAEAASWSVVSLLPEPSVDHAHTRRQLALEMGGSRLDGYAMQGLTSAEFTTVTRVTVGLRGIPGGKWCATAERVEVEFGFRKPPAVMLAREIPRGSCAWKSVLAHEMRHVETGRRGVRRGTAAMESALSSLLEPGLAFASASRAGAEKHVRQAVSSAVEAAAAEAVRTADRENAALDTPEEYEKLGQMCP